MFLNRKRLFAATTCGALFMTLAGATRLSAQSVPPAPPSAPLTAPDEKPSAVTAAPNEPGHHPPPPQPDLSEKLIRASRDSGSAGVAAVAAASDVLKSQGPQAAIDYFVKTLADVKNDAVKRAIRLQLIDLYRAANQPDKALETASSLMTDAAEEEEMHGPPGMGMGGGPGGPPDQQGPPR